MSQKLAVVAGRADDSLCRRKAKILNIVLELARVPLAVGRDGETAVGAYEECGTRLASFGKRDPSRFELRPVRSGKARIATVGGLREEYVVHHQAQRRTQLAPVFQHRLETLVVHPGGVQNHIDAGTR